MFAWRETSQASNTDMVFTSKVEIYIRGINCQSQRISQRNRPGNVLREVVVYAMDGLKPFAKIVKKAIEAEIEAMYPQNSDQADLLENTREVW